MQLNSAFEADPTLGELADWRATTPGTARFFGQALSLYRHQEEALAIAQRGEPYVVTRLRQAPLRASRLFDFWSALCYGPATIIP